MIALALLLMAAVDDGQDDRAELQAAIAAHCGKSLRLAPGVYDVARAWPVAGYSLVIDCPIRISADGATIRQMPAALETGENLATIAIRSSGVYIDGVTVDGARSTFNGGQEQVHAVTITTSSDVTLVDVTIAHSYGDCVKAVDADRLTISRLRCEDSRRSGITLHSQSTDVTIIGSRFVDVGDQQIDTEGAGHNARLLVADNVFDDGGAGAIVLDISGGGGAQNPDGNEITDVIIVNNVFGGGTVQIADAHRVRLANNVHTWTSTAADDGSIVVKGYADDVVIADSTVTNLGTSALASCVNVVYMDDGRSPHGVTVDGLDCRHAWTAGIRYSSAHGGLVVRDSVVRQVGAPSVSYGVHVTTKSQTGSALTAPLAIDVDAPGNAYGVLLWSRFAPIVSARVRAGAANTAVYGITSSTIAPPECKWIGAAQTQVWSGLGTCN